MAHRTFFAIGFSTPTKAMDIMLGDTTSDDIMTSARAGWRVYQPREITIDDHLRTTVDKWLSEFTPRPPQFEVVRKKDESVRGMSKAEEASMQKANQDRMGGFTKIYTPQAPEAGQPRPQIMVVFRFNTKHRRADDMIYEVKGIYLIEFILASHLKKEDRVRLIPDSAHEVDKEFFFVKLQGGGMMLNRWCQDFELMDEFIRSMTGPKP